MIATVSSLFIYPDSNSPGQELDAVEMTPTGPEGNRSKKHAVHLVTAEDYVETHPKANIVLDMDIRCSAGWSGGSSGSGSASSR